MQTNVNVDDDLGWYYGTGPMTLAGDSGLRSPLGGQLERIRLGLTGCVFHEHDDTERQEVTRATITRRAATIRERLDGLHPDAQSNLFVHYRHLPLKFGISPVAIFVRAASVIMGDEKVTLDRLKDKLRDMKINDGRVKSLDNESAELIAGAKAAYVRGYGGEARETERTESGVAARKYRKVARGLMSQWAKDASGDAA